MAMGAPEVTDGSIVSLVVDPHFGSRAVDLKRDGPVWLIESTANRLLADPPQSHRQSVDGGITLFSRLGNEAPSDSARRILDTVLDHHPNVRCIRIYGARLGSDLRAELAEQGVTEILERETFLECTLP